MDISLILMSDAITVGENRIWIVSLEKTMLIGINRISGQIELAKKIPNESNMHIPYRFIFYYEGFIYFIPYEENRIIKFDIEKNMFTNLRIDKEVSDSCGKMTSYVIINNYAVISGETSNLIILNLETDQTRILNFTSKLDEQYNDVYWVWRYSYSLNSKVRFVALNSPLLVEVDIYTEEVCVKKIEETENILIDNPILSGDEIYYFDRCEKGGEINKYDIKTKEKKKIAIKGHVDRTELRAYGFVAHKNGHIVCFPGTNDIGVAIDITSGEITDIDSLPVIESKKLGVGFPCEFNYRNGYQTADGMVILIHPWTQQIVEVNVETGHVVLTPIQNDKFDWDQLFMEEFDSIKNGGILKEWHSGMLKAYLKYI